MLTSHDLPERPGPRPRTTSTNPHQQLDQQPVDGTLRAELARLLFALPDVVERASRVSVSGARALCLRDDVPLRAAGAAMIGREFAHLHPAPDESAHAMLPPDVAVQAVEAGWAEPHPMAQLGFLAANAVMIYAPRDRSEVEVVYRLLRASYRSAGGRLPA